VVDAQGYGEGGMSFDPYDRFLIGLAIIVMAACFALLWVQS
jgi:hypothetical protein